MMAETAVNNVVDKIINQTTDEETDEEIIDKDINIIFPNYKEDKSFGGSKNLLHVNLDFADRGCGDGYSVKMSYITTTKYGHYYDLSTCQFDNDVNKKYINKLLKAGILNIGHNILDFSDGLKTKLEKLKIHSKKHLLTDKIIPNPYSYKNYMYTLWAAFCATHIIDGQFYDDHKRASDMIYLPYKYPESYSKYRNPRNTGRDDDFESMFVISIGQYIIDTGYMRKYLPYQLLIHDNSYTMADRDDHFIGDNVLEPSDYKTHYLYTDNTKPNLIGNKKYQVENIKLYIDKFDKLTHNLECANKHNNTSELLSILKLYIAVKQ
jgi:hypothetical protein